MFGNTTRTHFLGYRSLIEASEASGTATELDSNDPPVAEPEGTASDDGSYEGEVDEMEQNLVNHSALRREGETSSEYERRVNAPHISEIPIRFSFGKAVREFRAAPIGIKQVGIKQGVLYVFPEEETRFNKMLQGMAHGERPLPDESTLAKIQQRTYIRLAPTVVRSNGNSSRIEFLCPRRH